jgi:hypothetical protein
MELGLSRLEKRRKRIDRNIAVGEIVALAIAAFVTLLLRSHVQMMLDGLGGELPWLTRCVLAIPWPVMVCVFLVPGVWLLVKDTLIRDVGIRRWIDLLVQLSFFAWILFLLVGLLRPFVVFIQRID